MESLNQYIDQLPHGYPIRMIEEVVQCNDKCVVTNGIVSSQNPFLQENNILCESAYLEIIAQSSGIYIIRNSTPNHLFASKQQSQTKIGYLTIVHQLDIYNLLSLNNSFQTTVHLSHYTDQFYTFKAEIRSNNILYSEGEISLYVK